LVVRTPSLGLAAWFFGQHPIEAVPGAIREHTRGASQHSCTWNDMGIGGWKSHACLCERMFGRCMPAKQQRSANPAIGELKKIVGDSIGQVPPRTDQVRCLWSVADLKPTYRLL